MTVLVGGVSQLYQGDLDLGRRAVARLQAEETLPDAVVEDLHYGAVAVAQRLEELQPELLVLVGAEARGRPPGTVARRRIGPADLDLDRATLQAAVADAVTGYVTIDLAVEVAWALDALPARTVAVEVEPLETGPSEELSAPAERALEDALDLVRAEVRRAPLLTAADDIRERLALEVLEPAPALTALEELLGELAVLDAEGRWGRAFTARDRLRRAIAEGDVGDGMEHVDWCLWWAVIEELDRLQGVEAEGRR